MKLKIILGIAVVLLVGGLIWVYLQNKPMGYGRLNSFNRTVLNAATTASTTASAVLNVTDSSLLNWTVGATGASGTIKFACSAADTEPSFTAGRSATNTWDYVDIYDLNTETSIDGDSGISFAGTTSDTRLFQIRNANFKWCTTIQTDWHAGTLVVKLRGSTNW